MDVTGQIAGAERKRPESRLLRLVVAGVALLLAVGCFHLLLTVTSNQDELARHGRWLQDAGAFRTLLEEVADEAEASADADPAWFHDQVPAALKQELARGDLLAALPVEDGAALTDAWRTHTVPLTTALSWLKQDEEVRPDIVAEPARALAQAVAQTLPKAAEGLTARSERLNGERAWLLAVGALVALGSVFLAVLYLRLRTNRDDLALVSVALRENEERYRQMFEQNNAIKLLVAPGSGQIVEANRAACEFYGGTIQTLRALRLQNIVDSPDALQRVTAFTPDPYKTTLVMRHRLLSGDVRDVEMHVSPIEVHGNRMLYVILHDITDRLAMEKEMRRAEQLESLGVLAGGIAHDFNNFLASMIGNLQLARLDVEADTPVAEALSAADGACKRAQDLAKQLLTFTKGGTPVRHPTSLGDLLRQTVDFALRGTACDCAVDVARDLAAANVDESQISQVLHNLVINASQAMPEGGTIRVVARNREVARGDGLALQPGRYVHLFVEDTGIGIPADDLDRVFQPYFTTKKGGSGLGLATSYSIVRKHEGALTVESTVEKGTTFHIHLPAAQAQAASAPMRPTAATAGGERILWLEDDEAIASVIERMLGRCGYALEICHDGADVVERYARAFERGERFDLVVLDLTVPGGMGGKAALAELRAIDAEVRAVACSGRQDDEVFHDHAQHGFCGALAKPFTREKLADVLIDALASDQRASEAA